MRNVTLGQPTEPYFGQLVDVRIPFLFEGRFSKKRERKACDVAKFSTLNSEKKAL